MQERQQFHMEQLKQAEARARSQAQQLFYQQQMQQQQSERIQQQAQLTSGPNASVLQAPASTPLLQSGGPQQTVPVPPRPPQVQVAQPVPISQTPVNYPPPRMSFAIRFIESFGMLIYFTKYCSQPNAGNGSCTRSICTGTNYQHSSRDDAFASSFTRSSCSPVTACWSPTNAFASRNVYSSNTNHCSTTWQCCHQLPIKQ